MKKAAFLILVLTMSALPEHVFAQSPDASPWEVNAVAFGTAAVPFLSYTLARELLLDPANPSPVIEIGADTLHLTSLVPLFFQDASRGWRNLAVQGQFFLYTSASRLLFGDDSFVTYLFSQGLMDFTFINAYYTYRNYRDASNDPVYQVGDRTYDWPELLFSPFVTPEVFRSPLVWGVPVAVAGLWATYQFLFQDPTRAIWSTGQAYFEDRQAPIWAASLGSTAYWALISMMVGASEEMLFRGYLYDELSRRISPWAAKGFDVVVFSLVHIPFDIAQRRPWQEIAFLTAVRLAGTLCLDFAYDAGGLPYSVTIHMLGDFLSNLFLWTYTAGVPRSEVEFRAPFSLSVLPAGRRVGLSFRIPL